MFQFQSVHSPLDHPGCRGCGPPAEAGCPRGRARRTAGRRAHRCARSGCARQLRGPLGVRHQLALAVPAPPPVVERAGHLVAPDGALRQVAAHVPAVAVEHVQVARRVGEHHEFRAERMHRMRLAVQEGLHRSQAVPTTRIPVGQRPGVDIANVGHVGLRVSLIRTRYSFALRYRNITRADGAVWGISEPCRSTSSRAVPPKWDPTAFIAPTAVLIGDVTVEVGRRSGSTRCARRLRACCHPRGRQRPGRLGAARAAGDPVDVGPGATIAHMCTIHGVRRHGGADRQSLHGARRRGDRRAVSSRRTRWWSAAPRSHRRCSSRGAGEGQGPIAGTRAEAWVQANPQAYRELGQRYLTGLREIGSRT